MIDEIHSVRGREDCWWIDFARAAAAIAVVVGHLRAFVFVDFGETANLGWAWKAFYFLTGLGHQAVMVFFVLSGFLVGGRVCVLLREGKWSWTEYLTRRLVRLWVVLLPALVLTAIWDRVGMDVTGSSLYSGHLASDYHSTPSVGEQSGIYSFYTFAMNAIFLQTVAVPVLGNIPTFGTNGPLWSLANEFWYYVLFPLGLIAASSSQSAPRRILSLAGSTIICALLPKMMVLSGSIWLMGVALFAFNRDVTLPRGAYRLVGWISFGLLIPSLWVVRSSAPSLLGDVLVGALFTAILGCLIRSRKVCGPLALISRRFAGFSYTVYLTHFPFAALLACLILKNHRFEPSPMALIIFIAAIIVVIAYSYGIFLLFENNTKSIQGFVARLLEKRPGGPVRAVEPGSGY